jgi:hypothetical protein
VTIHIPPTPQRHLGVEARKLRHQLAWTPGKRLPGVFVLVLIVCRADAASGAVLIGRPPAGDRAVYARLERRAHICWKGYQ